MSLLRDIPIRYDLFFGVVYDSQLYASNYKRVKRELKRFNNSSNALCEYYGPCDNVLHGMIQVDECFVTSQKKIVQYDEFDLFSIRESTTDDHHSFCPHFNVLLRKIDSSIVDYLMIEGCEATAGFIPQSDSLLSSLFIEPSYYQKIKSLKLIDEAFLRRLTIVDLADLDKRGRLEHYSPELFSLSAPRRRTGKIIHCLPQHYTGNYDYDTYEYFGVTPRYYCTNCRFTPCYCPVCKSWFLQCPQCGKLLSLVKAPLENEVELSDEEHCYWLNIEKDAAILVWDYFEKQWKISPTFPLRGEYWGYQNIFETSFFKMKDNEISFIQGEFNFICSGKLARFIVEEQSGPLTLIPIPVDVSGCTSEQLEALESIAYPHPEAVPPVLKETT